MYSRFGLSAQVEKVLADYTQTIDKQEYQQDTVANIVILHHHNHYDILYTDASCHDYKQVRKVSCCMDEHRTDFLDRIRTEEIGTSTLALLSLMRLYATNGGDQLLAPISLTPV